MSATNGDDSKQWSESWAKKNLRKSSGASRIQVIDDGATHEAHDLGHESNGVQAESEEHAAKPSRKTKTKIGQPAAKHFGIAGSLTCRQG